MHFSSFVRRRLVRCALFAVCLFALCNPSLPGIVTFDQSIGRGGETAVLLQGPSGDILISPSLPPEKTGSLLPGRYTLSSGGAGGTSYNLGLDLTPSTAAVPLPPALWTGLSVLLLL